MEIARVIRLTVLGTLPADPEAKLRRTRRDAAAGDESWGEWVEDHARGRALIACVQVALDVGIGRRVERLVSDATEVWIESARELPAVERQLQDLAARDFAVLEEMLRRRSIKGVTARDLDSMFVDVQMDDGLVAAVAGSAG